MPLWKTLSARYCASDMPIPTQTQVDTVAAFVEAASAGAVEPFFGRDEKISFLGTIETARATCVVGDRLRFQSALVPFFRMWSPISDAHWEKAEAILLTTDLPAMLINRARWETDCLRRHMASQVYPQGLDLTVQRTLELWLNVMIASASNSAELRCEFEERICRHTHAVMEFTFRHQVHAIYRYHLSRLAESAAVPALDWYRTSFRLTPSATIGLPSRFRRRERTPDGRVVVREATSDVLPLESFAERYARLLQREENRPLQQLLPRLEATPEELMRAVLRGKGLQEVIADLDGRIDFYEFPVDKVGGLQRQDFVAAGNFSHAARFVLYHGNFLLLQNGGMAAFDDLLQKFRRQLLWD
jgi:hypothetical protein